MDIIALKTFFMWTSVINFGLLMLAAVMLIGMKSWVYKVHSKWFPMPEDTFNVVIYSFMGVWKMLWFIFCLIPFIALSIMTCSCGG